MIETLELILTKFTDETITITTSVMMFILFILIAYWTYNRKKFHKLSHQIPASVVKNYLDSIIQNSTALKSSLFRGGGLDISEGVPSVLPVSSLGSESRSGMGAEEMNQKNAEIANLRRQVSDKESLIKQLEAQIAELQSRPAGTGVDESVVKGLEAKNRGLSDELAALKEQLAKAGSGGGASSQEVDALKKERDELKERLQEYEIIEDDLANLKRLQQENEQLKKALAQASGVTPTEIIEEAPKPAAKVAAKAEEKPAAKVEAKPTEVGADGTPEVQDEQKPSADELLSEFEKMLG